MSASCSIEPDSTQVGQGGLLIGALLGTTVQLRQNDDGNLQFLRHQLQRTRELTDLLLARLDGLPLASSCR